MPFSFNSTDGAFELPPRRPVSTIARCPELWALYQRQIDSFATLRKDIFDKIERLRVPVHELHSLEWEAKTRDGEAQDLQVQLESAELKRSMQEQDVLEVIKEQEKMREYQQGAEARMQQAQAMAQPRIEEIRFAPDTQPERLAGFPRPSPKASGQSKLSQGSKSAPASQEDAKPDEPVKALDSRVQVSYVPHDLKDLLKAQLGTLEEQLKVQKECTTTAQSTVDRLRHIQEEEARMLKEALAQQLQRIQQRRNYIREGSETVRAQYLTLRFQHGQLEKRHKEDVSGLQRVHETLSKHLQEVAGCAVAKQTSVERQALRTANRTVTSGSAGQVRARENLEFAQDRLGTAQTRSSHLVRELEAELAMLSDRCRRLAGHRQEELTQLRATSAKLKQRMRDLEERAGSAVAEVGREISGIALADWPAFVPALQRLRADLDAFEITLDHERAALTQSKDSKGSSGGRAATASTSQPPTSSPEVVTAESAAVEPMPVPVETMPVPSRPVETTETVEPEIPVAAFEELGQSPAESRASSSKKFEKL